MTAQPENIRQKLIAISKLMDGATTPGEYEAAKRKLNQLCAKYNINLETLFEPKTSIHYFRYRDKFESRLLFAIYRKVTNTPGDVSYYRRGKSKQHGFELTEEQAIDMRLMYDAYRNAWEDAVENLFVAFLNKHHIFAADAPTMTAADMTAEQLKASLLRRDMLRSLPNVDDPRSAGYLEAGK